MVIKKDRDFLISIINDYIEQKINSRKFEDTIESINSKDSAVNFAVKELWYFYDDFAKHYASLDKYAWNYIQRILLLLKSDNCIEIKHRYKFTKANLSALLALIIYILIFLIFYKSYEPFTVYFLLNLFAMPVSLLISYYNQKLNFDKNIYLYFPFNNYKELSKVRRKVQDFKKKKYKNCNNPIRSKFEETSLNFLHKLLWFKLAPFALAFQAFPYKDEKVKIYEPKIKPI